MQKFKAIKSEVLFPVIRGILDEGRSARITVTGMSMYPFLRENIDSVELSNTNPKTIKKGDIVMVLRDTNEYVMHRVIKVEEGCFYMVGDAQEDIEGPLRFNQVFAKVNAIWRQDKRIDVENSVLKFMSRIWLVLRPFRIDIIKGYRALRR
ncbi:S24/S26 family peptidase [Clostridium manihotivorum]|uniref:Peptidase S24 n=1 Tax=Clostridium manihotivorum TaxID=2320868 RepID=A0A3R5QXC9_9CLOT|nr:S24/S26 family peptidase [Clostridium manihotivorum]QAA34509.1 peptidase S24 [Clostridium manihotivorum]